MAYQVVALPPPVDETAPMVAGLLRVEDLASPKALFTVAAARVRPAHLPAERWYRFQC
jgi:hypothetical protein